MNMDPEPRRVLRRIVQQRGPDVAQDSQRLPGLLADLCPDQGKERAALVAALREGIPGSVATSQRTGEPVVLLLARLTARLVDRRALDAAAAAWAVESWAVALGVAVPDRVHLEDPVDPALEVHQRPDVWPVPPASPVDRTRLPSWLLAVVVGPALLLGSLAVVVPALALGELPQVLATVTYQTATPTATASPTASPTATATPTPTPWPTATPRPWTPPPPAPAPPVGGSVARLPDGRLDPAVYEILVDLPGLQIGRRR